MDLSHNCSLHGGRSEVCENRSSDVVDLSDSGMLCIIIFSNSITVTYIHIVMYMI